MARNSYFQFKQFRVEQGQTAMKITTDACILGARAEVENSQSILDIGAGTGLLSLMAAQRSTACIDAVELDDQAAIQSRENFSASPWKSRLKLHHCSIQSFVPEKRYDCILSNPPFFENASKAPCDRRSLARHTDSLSFLELAENIDRLMSEDGKAWILLPTESSPVFLEALHQATPLKLERTLAIRSSDTHKNHRHLLVLGHSGSRHKLEQITIYSEHPAYTTETIDLLRPYYLKL
ncbi:tRNA1(Val) (adenine(37)-N6)-methyltransferase [Endozoicomonas sp. ALC020]|uniref:tRNA1(Val) (adenine(37)-N6)-methyltransferase n=1 Tax=unclassified Endozoicomonas TaxID=2644528 RepID=UPI003BAF963E